MPALAHHDTNAGPLTVADLDAARRDNPGSIWHPHRHIPSCSPWPCEWESCTGRACTDNARECQQAAPEGGAFHDPSPAMESMFRHYRIKATAALALLLAAAGFVAQFVWPLAA